MLETVINDKQGTAQYYIEDLGNGIELEMVLIPGGTFTMGAPEDEEGSTDSERPQHQVTVPTFFMGRYQVTQAQWRAVANLPKVERKLKPEPSHFKDDNLPVEGVSWFDAVEFCARLLIHTKRVYRLPSEAEWEYACRAGIMAPFHFGETITTDLANYDGTDGEDEKWSGSYGNGLKGIYRKETMPVGSFDAANAFGLSDMHGNVWEWCLDDYHDNYEGAPTDGRAWVKSENKNDNFSRKMLRGGSWLDVPAGCRSASHYSYNPDYVINCLGLRVMCVLSGANLKSANLSNADLSGANLKSANLSNADLSDANLSGANLSNVLLSNADLSGANLSNVLLSGANLSGANLSNVLLSNADLSGANLSNVLLSYAKLSNVLLSGANLSDANLKSANLSNANLSDANLSNAKLSNVLLSGANLNGAIFWNKKLRIETKNITPEQIKKAKNWEKAVYSPEFRKKLGLPPEK